ncbi:L,D-transpeptidase family protein [Anaerosporobacter faecicola]|uniref:L,D-transpeptidase family protein n=1 Tax=Anaerosporobacter faecicola TaxID=2718714 RepID=UPI00143BBBBD|nr:L,D-transpeptidase family protein [Anaerosporobacter faecicola]
MNSRITKKRSSLIKKLLIGSLLALVVILAGGYFLAVRYYSNHYWKNTMINGIDCSNKTIDEAMKLLKYEADHYVLTIEERDDIEETINGTDIDFSISFGTSLEDLMDEQNPYQWLSSLSKKSEHEFSSMITFDEAKLRDKIASLNAFNPSIAVAPTDAHISDYTEEGYLIVEETQGSTLKQEETTAHIIESVSNFNDRIVLDDLDCYVKPLITKDDKKLKTLSEILNKYTSTVLTYHFGDVTEVLDGSLIHTWLSIEDDQVILDEDKVKEYVDYIGKNYNSFGRKRKFKTSYDKTIKVVGGDYGWWLNRGLERQEIIEAIYAGTQGEKKPNYYQTAQQYGSDDVGNTYVEINLSAQHLFYYKDGELIVESDFVSGNVAKGHATPVGTYSITYKERDATLVGEDYETPVKYWMPFNGSIGLHDANWRDDFGKDIFLKNGSHGCINLPPKVAKKIYENISKGTAVVCYELPGTENYEVKDEKAKKADKNSTNSNESSRNN